MTSADQVPLWIGFITGFEAADGGGDAVGEMSRPFWPQAVIIGAAAQITAIAAMTLDARRRTFKLDSLFFIDRF